MIFREVGTLLIAGFFICIIGIGFFSHFYLGDDNKIEQTCEEVIENETGLKIDLTPN